MAVATFSWRRCHKTGNSGEERQLSGHLQSPTVIDDGRLVSEWHHWVGHCCPACNLVSLVLLLNRDGQRRSCVDGWSERADCTRCSLNSAPVDARRPLSSANIPWSAVARGIRLLITSPTILHRLYRRFHSASFLAAARSCLTTTPSDTSHLIDTSGVCIINRLFYLVFTFNNMLHIVEMKMVKQVTCECTVCT